MAYLYHRFDLDFLSKGNRKKINSTKAEALEKILTKHGCTTLTARTTTSGAWVSLLIGDPSADSSLEWIKQIISGLDLPYKYKESYS